MIIIYASVSIDATILSILIALSITIYMILSTSLINISSSISFIINNYL